MSAKAKILIGIPTYAQQMLVPCVSSLFSLVNQLAAQQIKFETRSISLSDISEARNVLASDFLRSDATHLCFIDADSEWDGAVVEMLQQNKPIISACFSGKKFDWDRVFLSAYLGIAAPTLNELAGSPVMKGDVFEICKSDYAALPNVGMGLTLIQRSVFEKMRDSFPDIEYRKPDSSDKFWNFFGRVIHPDTQHLLSEDYSFTYRASTVGIQSYLTTRFRTVHHGLHGFVFNKSALLELASRLQALTTQNPERV